MACTEESKALTALQIIVPTSSFVSASPLTMSSLRVATCGVHAHANTGDVLTGADRLQVMQNQVLS